MSRYRSTTSGLIVFASALLFSACGDMASAPVAPAADAANPLIVSGVVTTLLGDTAVSRFTVYPGDENRIMLGQGSRIEFPRNAICDMTTAGYGPGTWNSPCTPTQRAVTITAKTWKQADGRSRVDFQPALRFVPGKVVMLHLSDAVAAASPFANVLYCADGATRCVDESTADASLATRTDLLTGFVSRRVKHFSGYNVAMGFSDSGTTTEEPAY